MSSSIIVRLGALHALILALVFAQEQVNYTQVRMTIANEAAAIADTYYGLGRYSEVELESVEAIETAIARHVKSVVDEEWVLLAKGKLSDTAWERYVEVEVGLLNLQPVSPMQEYIWEECLSDWDGVSEYRRARELAARYQIPTFFWVVAVFGFFLVVLPYFSFEPSAANITTLAVLALYNGIVFYCIVSIGNPFSGAAPIAPDAFQNLLTSELMMRINGEGL